MVTPVSAVAEMVTAGTIEPVGSVTRPAIIPWSCCADARATDRASNEKPIAARVSVPPGA